jgi:hypothetical protein
MPTEVESFERIMQSMGMDPKGAPELMRSLGVKPPQEEDPARTLEDWAMENPMAAMQLMDKMPSEGGFGGMSGDPGGGFPNVPWKPTDAAGAGVGAAEALGGAGDVVGDVVGGAGDALGGVGDVVGDVAGGLTDLVTSAAAGTAGPLEAFLGVPIAIGEGLIGALSGIIGGLFGGVAPAAAAGFTGVAGSVAGAVGSVVGGAGATGPLLGGLFTGIGAILQGIASAALVPFGV